MKLGGIFRFELGYQVRRVHTWAFIALPAVAAFLFTRDAALADAIRDDFFINSPFAIAGATVVGCLLWLLVAPSIAGDAAARDIETRMDPLAYTVPVSRTEYLGGRFLAAFALNALILLGTTLGSLLAVYVPGVSGAAIGPFRPAAYITAYGFLALPNAFVATAIQFSLATLNRRARASYLGSILLFFLAYVVSTVFFWIIGRADLARLIDPIGVIITTEVLPNWTPLEKRTRLLELDGPLLWNRVLWIGIALGALAFTRHRFRFAHHIGSPWWSRLWRWGAAQSPPAGVDVVRTTSIAIPNVARTYGFTTRVRQACAIAWESFSSIAKSPGGLALLGVIPLFIVLLLPSVMEALGVPVLPRTARILSELTAPVTGFLTPWVIVPLLILFYAGELVWRERDAGLGETIDAAPVTESVLFLGKLLGLGLMLVVFMVLLTAAGLLVQVSRGYHDFQLGLYLTVFFGLQLPEYLLFAVLALVVHVAVDHKYVGHLAALLVYALLIFAAPLGLDHNLLVFGASPAWSYTEMRGFDATVGPWLWFKSYWAAWALLLAVVARLLWVRGRDEGLSARLVLARRRFTGWTIGVTAAALGLILALGGFVFYNTNVLNEYRSPSDITELRAEYERRYRRFESSPQPWLAAASLNVDIFPERRSVKIRGAYRLVNRGSAAIDSILLATIAGSPPRVIVLDRPAALVVSDDERGTRIYDLARPLDPGDSLLLSFELAVEPRGFRNSGIDPAVAANGTSFPYNRLPGIGYQRQRELTNPRDRRAHGLAPRPLVLASLYDTAARYDSFGGEGISMETVVSTSEDQVGVAPGVLRRTWTEAGRRYFHWATTAPIGSQYAIYSARYAIREARWNDVSIQVFHHPPHTATLDAMIRSVRASLDYYTAEFSPYRYGNIWLVEGGGNGIGMHAEPSQLTYTQGFTGWGVGADPVTLDLPFAVVAHEMAHQWWPGELDVAMVEGAPLFSEGLAWYSAMQVVKRAYGTEQLRRLMSSMREPNPWPRIRRGVPLLRADDPYAMYRRAPFAMYALSEYIGEARVNAALRRLIEAARSGTAPATTTLDLYRELQAVAPDSLQGVVRDLFEINTSWTFDTKQGTAEQTAAGEWLVTLAVDARKESVDSAGVETTLPMDDLVEIGIFAPAGEGEILGRLLYLRKHRIRSGVQTITVRVAERPDRGGIDPYSLLDWEEGDNIEGLTIRGAPPS